MYPIYQALAWIGIGNSVLIAVKRWTQLWIKVWEYPIEECPLYTSKGPALVQMAMLIAGIGTRPIRDLSMVFHHGIKTGTISSLAFRVIYALSHVDNFKTPPEPLVPDNETPPAPPPPLVGLMPLKVNCQVLLLVYPLPF